MIILLTYLKEINHISKFLSVEFIRGRKFDSNTLNVKKMLHILLLFAECLSLFDKDRLDLHIDKPKIYQVRIDENPKRVVVTIIVLKP